jgi:hypothetical protein
MKPIFLAILLMANANAGESLNSCDCKRDIVTSPLYDQCIALVDEPTFDFPISRAIGVETEYRFEPTQEPEHYRIFSFNIAMTQ